MSEPFPGIDLSFWLPILTGLSGVIFGGLGAWWIGLGDLRLRRRVETHKAFFEAVIRVQGQPGDEPEVKAAERMAAMYVVADMARRDRWLRHPGISLLDEQIEWISSRRREATTTVDITQHWLGVNPIEGAEPRPNTLSDGKLYAMDSAAREAHSSRGRVLAAATAARRQAQTPWSKIMIEALRLKNRIVTRLTRKHRQRRVEEALDAYRRAKAEKEAVEAARMTSTASQDEP